MAPTANIGVDLAAARLLDIAPDSPVFQAEFIARGLTPTFTFYSGGGEGHQHWLYRLPEGVPQARICRSGEYDILSSGYAILPPSRHISGGLYTVVDDLPLGDAPRWAGAALIDATRRPKGRIETGGEVSSDEAINRLVEQLDPDIWNGNRYSDRSTSLIAIAGDLAKLGANQATIVALLRERDVNLNMLKFANRRNADEQYQRLAARAVEENPPSIPVGTVGKVKLEVEEPKRAKLVFVPTPELLLRPSVEIDWYAPGFVGSGLLTEIDGYAKLSGKTTFVQAALLAMLNGGDFLGRAARHPGKAVYLTEQTIQSLKPGLVKAGLAEQWDLHWLTWADAYEHPWHAIVAETAAHALDVGAGLVVIDTLAQWSDLGEGQEDDAGVTNRVLKPVLAEMIGKGLAVWLVRHDRKSGGQVGQSARGSSAYGGKVDVIMHLESIFDRGLSANARLLTCGGRFMGDSDNETPREPWVIELLPVEPFEYRLLGTRDEVASDNADSELLGVMPTSQQAALDLGCDQAYLREQTGWGESKLRSALAAKVREGRVESATVPGGNSRLVYWQKPLVSRG
jgi:hypothetical protein